MKALTEGELCSGACGSKRLRLPLASEPANSADSRSILPAADEIFPPARAASCDRSWPCSPASVLARCSAVFSNPGGLELPVLGQHPFLALRREYRILPC